MVGFRSRAGILEVQCAATGADSVTFELPTESGPVTVELSQNPDHDEMKMLLTAVTYREVNQQRQASLESLASGQVPTGCTPANGIEPFDDGTPHPSIVSHSVQDLFSEVIGPLGQLSYSVASSLRWRYGLRVPIRALGGLGAEFSVDGQRWIPIPRPIAGRTWAYAIGTPIGPHMATDIPEALQPELSVPPGHELLFEAEELGPKYTRSTLVLSLAAIEVGVKRLIATLVPGSEWLVEHLPSPPLASIIEDYLPTLPVRGQLPGTERPDPKEALLRDVRKAARLRNELVHTGAGGIDFAWLDGWLELCSSLLYAFDCFSGRAWAGPLVEERHRVLIAS